MHNYNQNDQTNFVSRKTAENNAIYDHPENSIGQFIDNECKMSMRKALSVNRSKSL